MSTMNFPNIKILLQLKSFILKRPVKLRTTSFSKIIQRRIDKSEKYHVPVYRYNSAHISCGWYRDREFLIFLRPLNTSTSIRCFHQFPNELSQEKITYITSINLSTYPVLSVSPFIIVSCVDSNLLAIEWHNPQNTSFTTTTSIKKIIIARHPQRVD